MLNATWRLKTDSDRRRRDILKEERTSERKTKHESEETNDETNALLMGYEKRHGLARKEDIKRLEAFEK